MNVDDAKKRRMASLSTPTDLPSNAVRDLAGALNVRIPVIADRHSI